MVPVINLPGVAANALRLTGALLADLYLGKVARRDDPRIAGLKIDELKRDFTIVIVTHNLQQAAGCADQVAFLYLGELVEVAPAARMFTAPRERRTQDYITGRFG